MFPRLSLYIFVILRGLEKHSKRHGGFVVRVLVACLFESLLMLFVLSVCFCLDGARQQQWIQMLKEDKTRLRLKVTTFVILPLESFSSFPAARPPSDQS